MDNENNRSLMPAGNKAFPTVDVSAGTEMPNGILSMKPLKAVPTTHQQMGPNIMSMDPPARPSSR
jgi:hypothetical protein